MSEHHTRQGHWVSGGSRETAGRGGSRQHLRVLSGEVVRFDRSCECTGLSHEYDERVCPPAEEES